MARGEAVVAVRRIMPRRLEIVPRRTTMTVARVRAKVEKKGRRGVAVAQGAAIRGAEFAKAQVSDLAVRGQRLTHGVDTQIEQVTGKRSAAWIDGLSRFFRQYRLTSIGMTAVAAYALLVLLV
jgi:hypothetical protein